MLYDIKDTYYFLAIIALFITGVMWVINLKGDINLLKMDLANHKYNHEKLEQQVKEHEEKIDSRLIGMSKKIDANHKEVTETLSEIKISIAGLKKDK